MIALLLALSLSASESSVARIWDEQALAAIRIDLPNPPVHARNLFHLSIVMYDAWAAYSTNATGYIYHHRASASDVDSARREAISYAAYRLLREREALSYSSNTTLAELDSQMAALGYDTNNFSLDPNTPAGIGNAVYQEVSSYFINDGAEQLRGYRDLIVGEGGYAAVNVPLLTGDRGTLATDVNRWQPLAITNGLSQNNIPTDIIQKFVGAQWRAVRPFSLSRTVLNGPWIDPGPPPRLGSDGTESDAEFRDEVVEVIRFSSQLTPFDGGTMDISPGTFGNNSLGTNDGHGHELNPITGLPYSFNVVPRGDFGRVLAEFWADGPHSETPPGHWNLIANRVADTPGFQKRMGGVGPVLNDLEWDVKVYFALNAALHDAACAAWTLKRHYDGWRPLTAIHYMGQRGQSSDSELPSYDPAGLPLAPGLIELVTPETSAPGGRHAGMQNGRIAILAWPGPPKEGWGASGSRWIYAADWMPYQKSTFVTPAFPGYVSGHSSFSRAAAEVLAAVTGSEFFPGGMMTYEIPAGTFLTFEQGPSQNVQLQWATYFDAADQAGISRIWGGIHSRADDFAGRRVGAECGKRTWQLAQQYFNRAVESVETELKLSRTFEGDYEINFNATRGFLYKIEFTDDLQTAFQDLPGSEQVAGDVNIQWVDPLGTGNRYYRVINLSVPDL